MPIKVKGIEFLGFIAKNIKNMRIGMSLIRIKFSCSSDKQPETRDT